MRAAHDRSVCCSDIEKIIFAASNTHKYVAKEGSRNFFCRRAPHGARGLKLADCMRRSPDRSRAPHGARGLKPDCLPRRRVGLRRAPHGARGLKLLWQKKQSRSVRSRPARGAWIETLSEPLNECEPLSRPARGAWIETRTPSRRARCSICRAPHGARGLKPCGTSYLRTG